MLSNVSCIIFSKIQIPRSNNIVTTVAWLQMKILRTNSLNSHFSLNTSENRISFFLIVWETRKIHLVSCSIETFWYIMIMYSYLCEVRKWVQPSKIWSISSWFFFSLHGINKCFRTIDIVLDFMLQPKQLIYWNKYRAITLFWEIVQLIFPQDHATQLDCFWMISQVFALFW